MEKIANLTEYNKIFLDFSLIYVRYVKRFAPNGAVVSR